jgi:hypothetical protein
MDYQLSVVGVVLGTQVGQSNIINNPRDLVNVLKSSLGESGFGYSGPAVIFPWYWRSPYE